MDLGEWLSSRARATRGPVLTAPDGAEWQLPGEMPVEVWDAWVHASPKNLVAAGKALLGENWEPFEAALREAGVGVNGLYLFVMVESAELYDADPGKSVGSGSPPGPGGKPGSTSDAAGG